MFGHPLSEFLHQVIGRSLVLILKSSTFCRIIFRQFYDISSNLDPKCLLVRCLEGKKKNIYFTSSAIRDIVLSNENNVKMINTGVKTFVRCDNKNMRCAFRLAQEGMRSIFHYVGESRKVKILKEDIVMLLQNDDHHTPPEIVKLSQQTQDRVKDFGN